MPDSLRESRHCSECVKIHAESTRAHSRSEWTPITGVYMSEWRIDPVTRRSALIAPERTSRPVLTTDDADTVDEDPFLEGHEHETPGELMAIRASGTEPDSPGWQVRVVPNRFPAVQFGRGADAAELRNARPAEGTHEVFIECPHFETNLGRLPANTVVDVLRAYRERMRVHSQDSRLKQAVIFKNQGRAAGATIAHSHSQLIAVPFVLSGSATNPENVTESFEDVIQQEVSQQSRIVHQCEQLLVWCPRVSRFSYETRIVAQKPVGRFEEATDELLQSLGVALKQTLRRLEIVLSDPPLNFILHTTPFGEHRTRDRQWWLEIIPRLSGIGGFELGSGCFITTTFPEEAARRLREIPDNTL